jgi:phosphate transport system substrate-binding protein
MRLNRYRSLFAGLLGLCVVCGVGCWTNSNSGGGPDKSDANKTDNPNAGVRLEGAGSTFVDPMMQEWSKIYENEKRGQIDYQATGSGAGISKMMKKEVLFGCSDDPLSDKQITDAKKEVLHIPLCMGALVIAYNLDGNPDLVFDGQTLIDIYLGNIKKWNDDRIKKLQKPEVADKLPDLDIAVAYRSDSSGSTAILTDYFTKVNKDAWKPGKGKTINFPAGTGCKETNGVAGYVKGNKGAIGYVELLYAKNNGIKYASIVNSKGKTIAPTPKSITAAAASVKIPDDLRYSITNADGDDAYPIAGTVWAIVYAQQPEDKAKPLADFLTWVTHDGQKHCEKLDYAPLPENIVKKIDEKIKKIRSED